MSHKYTCLRVGVGIAVLLSQPSTAWAQPGPTNLVIAKSHSGNFTAFVNGVYTIVVSNSGGTASSGQITVEDILPSDLRVVSATGNAWSCVVRSSCQICPGETDILDCTRSSAIAPGVSASPITLTGNLGIAGTVTNTATVSWGSCCPFLSNADSDLTIIVAPIPTLPPSALIALNVLLALAGVTALRRRTT
jgi:uncharacterized repeat protein (TIGR01451 family)